MDDEKAWLAELKVGDQVAIPSRFGRGIDRIESVARLTPTQIVLTDGSRYQRDDGYSKGRDAWHSHFLRPVTPEIQEAVENRRLYQTIRSMTESYLGVCTGDELRAILAILEKAKERK